MFMLRFSRLGGIALVLVLAGGAYSCRAQDTPPAVPVNPSFSDGTDAPAAWELGKDSAARLVRDTQNFQSAPAALRLDISGTNGGTAQQAFVPPAASFTLSGATKTQGQVSSLSVVLQVFNDNYSKQLVWITSDDNDANKLAPSATWRPFSRKISLPDGAAHVVFYFTAKGSAGAKAWLDDVVLNAPPVADHNPAADNTVITNTAPVTLAAPETCTWKNAVMGGVEFATGIVFNPKRPELMYSRNDTGGVYRFDRAGKRWVQLMDSIPYRWSQLFVADSLAVDANNPNTLYVATGGGRWGNMHDVLKTTDGGRHWTRTGLKNADGKDVFADPGGDEKPAGERLAVDPNDSRVLLYATRSDGLFRSGDGAKTWHAVPSFPAKGSVRVGLTFVAFDWRGGSDGVPTRTIYAGVHAGKANDDANGPNADGGVYKSADAGKTWTLLTGGPGADAQPIRGRIGIDHALYVSTHGQGLWRYKIGQWTNITPPGFADKPFSGIGLHPTDPNKLLSITYDDRIIFYTKDGGKNWQQYKYLPNDPAQSTITLGFQPAWQVAGGDLKWPTGFSSDVQFDPLNPAIAYETDFSGANIGTGVGTNKMQWSLLSEGREQMTCGDVFSPASGAPLISGVWDVGGFRHDDLDAIPARRLPLTQADGTAFTGYDTYRNSFQDMFQLDGTPSRPDSIVTAGGWQWNNTGDAAYSNDNGRTFHLFAAKPFDGAKFGRIVMGTDPNNILWAPMGDSSTPVYFTRDNGKTWTAAQGAPLGTVAPDGPWSFYKLLAADRVKPGTFYLYDRRDGRFYRSADGGATWKHVATLPKQQGVHWDAHRVFCAPGRAGDVWVSLCGATATGAHGLFHSADGGDTWTRLTNVQWAQAFAFGAGKPGGTNPALYLFGQIGGSVPADPQHADIQLYRSDNMGQTWTRINDDAHQFAGMGSMTGDGQTWGRVYLSTGGRGVFYGQPTPARVQ